MRFLRAVAAAMLLVPSVPAIAEGPVLDTEAIDIARASAEFLASRPAMSFNWFVSYDEVREGREKLTYMRSGTNLLVRDKGFYSYVDDDDGVREYFFDGAAVTVAAPEEGFYATGPFDGSFEALVQAMRAEAASELPLYGLMTRDLAQSQTEGLDGAAYLGITRIAGREVHHLAFSDYDEDWQIWISTDPADPVPVAIVGTNPYEQGWPQYRAYLTNWDFEPEPADGAFTFTPSPDDERITFPDLKARARGDAETGASPAAPMTGADPANPPAAVPGAADAAKN